MFAILRFIEFSKVDPIQAVKDERKKNRSAEGHFLND